AMPVEYWWAWIGQERVVAVAKNVRSGEFSREVLRIANITTDLCNPAKRFILWLFPRVLSAGSTDYQRLLEITSQCLQSPETRHDAITAILQYSLPITIPEEMEASVVAALGQLSMHRQFYRPHKKND